MCKVSIIMPAYNVENYIEESILSVFSQDETGIELIVVNDGSSDNTLGIIKQLEQNSPIPMRILSQDNMGLPAARNIGLDMAKGRYVCFIDSDDVIVSNHISSLLKIADSKKCDIVFSDYEETTLQNRCGNIANENVQAEILSNKDAMNFLLRRKPAIHCCTLLIKTDFLQRRTIKFDPMLRKYGEDAEFMWRLFSEDCAVGRTRLKTYKYLLRENSIMSTFDFKKGENFSNRYKSSLHKLAEKYPENTMTYKYAYYRNMLGWLHTTAKTSTYNNYIKVLNYVGKTEITTNLRDFPEWKTRVLVRMIMLNEKLAYYIMK